MGILANLARMSTATTGTGTITLGSAVTGFLSFATAGITNGQEVSYAIEDGNNREVGRGIYTTAGTTLTRSVLKSTNAGAAISLSGTAQVFVTALAEDFGGDVQTFTSSGTWTKPAGKTFAIVEMLGAGGGGGSGRRGAAASDRGGGSGGSGGSYAYGMFALSSLGATETVTIGAPGTGGAAIAVNTTSGNNGTAGGNTTFGTNLTAFGGGKGKGGTAADNNSDLGAGVLSAAGDPAVTSGPGHFGAGSGSNGATSFGGATGGPSFASLDGQAGGCSWKGGPGGASGGSISSANTASAGGTGGSSAGLTGGGASGGAIGSAGNSATGRQGGGGGGSGVAAGGAGAIGGAGSMGGGGGGGGASLNGSNSGAGGAGGSGWCRVTCI